MSTCINDSKPIVCGFKGDSLAKKVAKKLDVKLTLIKHGQFNDTSSNLKIDVNTNKAFGDRDVHVIAGNCRTKNQSINETTMETFLAVQAAKETTNGNVKLYLKYLGYARQDKVSQPGESRAATVVLKMFETAGAKEITVLDIHNEKVFYDLKDKTKKINLFAMDVFAKRFKKMHDKGADLKNLVVVAPDKGARERARLFQKAMQDAGFKGISFAYFDKSRDDTKKGEVSTMDLREFHPENCEKPFSGEKAAQAFKGTTAIIVDDIADTCGTMLRAIKDNIILKYHAKQTYAVITHGVFSKDALDKIKESKDTLKKILVTDSVPLRDKAPTNLEQVSCASVFADAIKQSLNTH